MVPSLQKDIPYCAVTDLDFISAKNKKMKADDVLSAEQPPHIVAKVKCTAALATVQTPNHGELEDFFNKLSTYGTKPAILSVVDPFASNYIPKCTLPNFPQPLQELYDENLHNM